MNSRLMLTLILILLYSSTYAQVSDSIYYNRLFYVCKAWGHVKYFHTETAKGSVNWDNQLLNALDDIKGASDNASFNNSLLLMLKTAGEMGVNSQLLPNTPDSLNNITDYSWIQDSIFSDEVEALLDTVQIRFRPQSNVYVDEAWSGGAPTFDTDDLYYSDSHYPDENTRILSVFRYWNIINYFFPYKNIMDQDWDTTLMEFIPQIVEAKDALSYHQAFRRLTAKINDSHSFFISPTFNDWLGSSYTPFEARFIENEMVITKVVPELDEISVGEVIKEIGGFSIYDLRDSLREYSYGSNNVVIEREINKLILRGASGEFSLSVDDGETIHDEMLSRNSNNLSRLNEKTGPIWRDTTINESCNYGIVDMGRLQPADVSQMFDDLWFTDAIIFDIRNYPNGTLWEIVNYLYPSAIHMANFTVPDITYPGRMFWTENVIGSGTSNKYAGKVIMLFDERTQSQAEFTAMGLEQFPDAIKIGSTTSGADGNIARIYLPGKIETAATFLGTFYPDYSPTQRVGIIPDYEVHPTISGIRSGQDEVLSFALDCDFVKFENGITGIETIDDVTLYPNPARNEIRYDLKNYGSVLIELYDLSGNKLISTNSSSGTLDISELSEGVYLVKIHIDDNKRYNSRLVVQD